jgi:hypothetical protein
MFFLWVRRRALKGRATSAASMLLKQGPGRPQMVVIVGMAGLFIAVGAVMYVRVQADASIPQCLTGCGKASSVVTGVDGVAFPVDGQFDLNYLPNGRHKIVYGTGESAFSNDIDVNNDLGPLVAARNRAFGFLHGNKPAVDRAELATAIGIGVLIILGVLRHWLRYRIRSNVK